MPDYPRTKDEWWEFVDNWWKQLESIVLNYYPNQSDFPKDGWPALKEVKNHAYGAQCACNFVTKELRKKDPVWHNKGSFKDHINDLKIAHDPRLATIFNSAWFGIPEYASSRRIPGFNVFCDLCSESHVLDRKKE